MEEINPFEPSASIEPAPANPMSDPAEDRELIRWIVCFAFNLPVCLLLGIYVCHHVGRGFAGMGVAVLSLFALSVHVQGRWPDLMLSVRIGAWVVGFLQLLPILQIGAGAIAIFITGHAGDWSRTNPLVAELKAFATVLMTGLMLSIVALSLGILLRFLAWVVGPSAQDGGRTRPR